MAIDRVIIGTKLSVLSAGQTIASGSFEFPVVTKAFADTGYTATASDFTILCNCTDGAITINLPTAAGITGRMYNIKKIDSTANAVTIDANGAETIDGAATQAVSFQYENYTLQSDGTNWVLI